MNRIVERLVAAVHLRFGGRANANHGHAARVVVERHVGKDAHRQEPVRELLTSLQRNPISLEVPVTPHSSQALEALVMRMQDDFLKSATLKLTVPEAEERFRVDRATCEAVLGVLVEAQVLARTREGTYARFFPRLAHAA